MDAQVLLTGVCCAMVVGLGGWLLLHSVDRQVHPEGRLMVSEEVFLAKLAGLEDRLRGEIAVVKVKLEDLEEYAKRK